MTPSILHYTLEQLDEHVQAYRAPLLGKIAELEERLRQAEQRESATRIRIRARIDAMQIPHPSRAISYEEGYAKGRTHAKSEVLEILDDEWEKP